MDLIIEPHMSDGHAVLCQGSSLIWADGGSGAQSLDSFKVLHQAVLSSHAFSCEGQTYLHGETERKRENQEENQREQERQSIKRQQKENVEKRKEKRDNKELLKFYQTVYWHIPVHLQIIHDQGPWKQSLKSEAQAQHS